MPSAGRFRLPKLGTRDALFFRGAVGVLLVAITLLALNPGRVVEELRGTYWPIAAVAVASLCGLQILGVAAWRFSLLHLSGIRLGWAPATRVYYAALAAGSVTPSNLGADAYRVYALSASHAWRRLVAPIAFQRLTSYIAIIALGGLASVFLPLSVGSAPIVIGLLVLASVCGFVLLVPRGRMSFARLPGVVWLLRKIPRDSFWPQAGSGRRLVVGTLVLSFLFHGGAIGLGYVLVVALQADADPLRTLAVLAVARLAILVPFTAHGLGVQEGAMAVLFPLAGMPAEIGLAASFLNRLSLVLTVGVGTAFLLLGTTARQTRPAPSSVEGLADAHGPYSDSVGSA